MINPNLDIACTILAEQLMFTNCRYSELDETLSTYFLQFRKGKTAEDIRTALAKGIKAGHAKTEFEISMAACYLSKVVKLA